jgi:hypothetical protein
LNLNPFLSLSTATNDLSHVTINKVQYIFSVAHSAISPWLYLLCAMRKLDLIWLYPRERCIQLQLKCPYRQRCHLVQLMTSSSSSSADFIAIRARLLFRIGLPRLSANQMMPTTAKTKKKQSTKSPNPMPPLPWLLPEDAAAALLTHGSNCSTQATSHGAMETILSKICHGRSEASIGVTIELFR